MKPSDLIEACVASIESKEPLFIRGKPGTGKTSLVFQAASRVFDGPSFESAVGGFPDVPWYLPFPAVDRDIIDVRGLAYQKNGKMLWTPSDLLDRMEQSPDGGVFCIEELPQAVPLMQCTLREPLLNRTIGGKPLPDNWAVLATGNRQQDRAGAGMLLSHVARSATILEIESSLDDWQAWALQRGIRSEIRGYLQWKPDRLNDFSPSREIDPSERAWERVHNVWDHVFEKLRFPFFAGIVGDATAGDFMDYLELYATLPNPDDVLKDPEGHEVYRDASKCWALTMALVGRCKDRKDNVETLKAALTYCFRLPLEFATKMVVDMTTVAPKAVTVPELKKYLEGHPELWEATSAA